MRASRQAHADTRGGRWGCAQGSFWRRGSRRGHDAERRTHGLAQGPECGSRGGLEGVSRAKAR
ncbi:hypothetical protein T492DRAFT_938428 [Pavlovales sp. CCMP2436]|nr:hypothetical protein T492DRAFT_938428 [Pavlovales sp. CCMP2436]